MINKLFNFLKKKELESKLKHQKSKIEETIQSGKTQIERDRLRALALAFDRANDKKLTIEDEKWLDEHGAKERKRKEINENKRKKENKKGILKRKNISPRNMVRTMEKSYTKVNYG